MSCAAKTCPLLKRAEVQARLHLPPDQHLTHPESGTCRALYDCPDLPLGPKGELCRVVIATHPASAAKSRVGVERAGVVSELFLTNLPQSAFTAADVVALASRIAAPSKMPLRMRIRSRIPTAGVVMPPGVRSAGKSSPNGCGTCACNWAMRLIPRPSARQSLLLLPCLRTRRLLTPLPPRRGIDQPKWLCPGNADASLVATLSPSRTGRCAVPPGSHCMHTSGAEKAMGACAWSMRPAFAVAALALCASSVNGRAASPPSRAK
jgi:hypothetical protein